MVIDRLSRWVLNLLATLMLFAGVAALVAGGLMVALATENPLLGKIVGVIFEIAAVLVVAGGVATFLSRARRPLLPNEHMTATGDSRPPVGGWLIVLASVLVALPIGLVLGLREFFAGWSELANFLDSINVWEGANANMSGAILIPLAGALAPALFVWAALAHIILGAVILLWSLAARAPGFPRLYLAWGVLIAALVISSGRGADAVVATGQALQPYLAAPAGGVDETAALRDYIGRYAATVGFAASVLLWALCIYLMWLPMILWSRRARTTFAPAVQHPDIESITRHPRSRL